MSKIQFLTDETTILRLAMERCSKGPSPLPTSDFPVMNCKFASLLLAYHIFHLSKNVEIIYVVGFGKNMVSHVWLEIEDLVFDITGDQFNMIEDEQLYEEIIVNRPYPNVHIEKCSQTYLYKLFERAERMHLDPEFSTFKTSFIRKLESSYEFLKPHLA
ncbi:hypothetical protein HUO09_08545 [Vibrio sp. Y2-5]|uniref:hypothetical protein n=1 Tax=Vibrio sp. Y2-5 TaxID=2743977 RepID=UPI001661689A|nr:hypothetical protein [Vibrio sp. Y2-5]MBD0786394.1 hypothetical protein [Vibrio sp. Y2-5]